MKPTQLKALMKLMTAHRIERLCVGPDGSVTIVKKIHLYEAPKETAAEEREPSEPMADPDEDVLFYSSGAPKLALRDLEKRSANPVKPPEH